LDNLVKIYQSAFAEPPWNENWSFDEVVEDLNLGLNSEGSIVLVAEYENQLLGFTWGYNLPLEKFSFLESLVSSNSSYMDEIAVMPFARIKNIGSTLCQEYFKSVSDAGLDSVVLRTDIRNEASMALFKKNGFTPVVNSSESVYDPIEEKRIYLEKVLEVTK